MISRATSKNWLILGRKTFVLEDRIKDMVSGGTSVQTPRSYEITGEQLISGPPIHSVPPPLQETVLLV